MGASQGILITRHNIAGEDVILHLIDSKARRNYYLQTLTFVDLWTLDKYDLIDVLNNGNFPFMRKFLRKKAFSLALKLYAIEIGKEMKKGNVEKAKYLSTRYQNKPVTTEDEVKLEQFKAKPAAHLGYPGYRKGCRTGRISKSSNKLGEELGKELDHLLYIARRLDLVYS